jgi:hypothetical protein
MKTEENSANNSGNNQGVIAGANNGIINNINISITNLSSQDIELSGDTGKQLISGAWTHLDYIEKTYNEQFKNFIELTNKKEHELAASIYWKILYYSGYRERWIERGELSKRMLDLSKQVKDDKLTGLILAKGMAYSCMAQEKYDDAQFFLEQAHKCFVKTHIKQDIGVYYEYMGDNFSEAAQPNKANDFYEKARYRYKDLDRLQVELKLLFLKAKYNDVNNSRQIEFLRILRNQFKAMANYREGLVGMEIARRLYDLKETEEAFYEAEQAYNFFSKINMPRNTKKANEFLQNIHIIRV